MFSPKTNRIKQLAEIHQKAIRQLESLLVGTVNMYVDYANVRPWSTKLDWNIDLKRLKQLLDSFDNVASIKFYNGLLQGDKKSEKFQKEARKAFAEGLKSKPVKIMKQSIQYRSIKPDSSALLEKFIRKCLLMKYDLETIKYLNEKFKKLNQSGIYYIEDRKCNFDVEIDRDMSLDYERNEIDTFVLWSGDSDFYDCLNQLLIDDKKAIIFSTAGHVARELNSLKEKGLFIFEIQKIRNFICWKKQITRSV